MMSAAQGVLRRFIVALRVLYGSSTAFPRR
jgi:hypothetical protein